MRSLLLALSLLVPLKPFDAQAKPVADAAAQTQPSPNDPAHQVPVVNAGLGDCSVEFHVTDAQLKPIYGAQISVHMRYGFGGFHKMDLQVSTNVDGRARFEGLTERARMPLEFNLEAPDRQPNAVAVDLREKCKSVQEVLLPAK